MTSASQELIQALGGPDFLVRRVPLAHGYLDLLTGRQPVATFAASGAIIQATAAGVNVAQFTWPLDVLMNESPTDTAAAGRIVSTAKTVREL